MTCAKNVRCESTDFDAMQKTAKDRVLELLKRLPLELRAHQVGTSSLIPIVRIEARLTPENRIHSIVCWPDANYRYRLQTCYPAPLVLEDDYPFKAEVKPQLMKVTVSAGETRVLMAFEKVGFEIHF